MDTRLNASGPPIPFPPTSNAVDDRAALFLCDHSDQVLLPSALSARLAVNSGVPFEFENDLFVGRIAILHREPAEWRNPYRFREYFGSRKRRWELRWQGRFKRPLTSPIHFGVEVSQDHASKLNFASRAFLTLLVKFSQSLARNRGSDLYTNSTDEEPGSVKYFRFPIHNCDMILQTASGLTPPDITGEFPLDPSELHTQCNEQFKQDWTHLDVSATYTFVFYSMYVDFVSWDVQNVPIGLNGMSLNRLAGNQPVNVVMRDGPDGANYMRLVVGNRCTSPAWASYLTNLPCDHLTEFFSAASDEWIERPVFPRNKQPRSQWWVWRGFKRLLNQPTRYVGACLRAPVSFVMSRPSRRRQPDSAT